MSEGLITLVEVTAYDPAIPGTRVLRFTSGLGTMTRPTEVPPNVHFAPRLQQPIRFKRTMFSAARLAGGSTVGVGDIVLNNLDQGLAYLRDLGIDGREVVVRVGPQDAPYPAGFTTFLTGTAEQVEVGARTATIRLRDKLHLLALPLQVNLYAGNNALPAGAEGSADDIKGRRKPLLFGRRYQLIPILVNTARLIYQFHDGQAHAVDAVYDQGVALTFSGNNRASLAALEAATIAAGQFDTCLALGLVRLGASAVGRVTMDARGDATGGYVAKAGEIVQRMLTQRCGIAVGDLDAGSFTTLNAAATGECGVHLSGEVTRQQAIGQVLSGCGGWLAPTRTGLWQVGQLLAPTGSPAFTFTDVEIEALDTLATRDADAGIPVWRVRLRGRSYVETTANDLVAVGPSLTEARRAELLQPWREAIASDPAVQTAHLLAPEMLRDTCLQQAADMATEANRVLALHKLRRDFTQAGVWLTQARAAIDLGSAVRLVTSRLGYGAGRDFRVVGIDVDGVQTPGGPRSQLTLDLWG